MFLLRFWYKDKVLDIPFCYGFSYSPAGRNMYVKYKKDGKFITQSFYTKFVGELGFWFYD